MAWARVDDQWFAHRKVVGLSLAARGLWATVLSWSCGQRTDHVTDTMVTFLAAGEDGVEALIAELEQAGLWHRNVHGWVIHDWHEYFVRRDRRAAIPSEVREFVYARDGHRCVECGSDQRLTLDHIKPWSKGGTDMVDNLQTMCLSCNSAKGDAWEGVA